MVSSAWTPVARLVPNDETQKAALQFDLEAAREMGVDVDVARKAFADAAPNGGAKRAPTWI